MSKEKKYLIVNADDFGMCHSTNEAIYELITNNCIHSTTIITVAPYSLEAIRMSKEFKNKSVGVHISHTSEWEVYRWRPFTCGKSLVDETACFPKTTKELLEKATIEDLINEATYQIEYLIRLGINISHIDNHMISFINNPKEYLELACKYQVGCRFASFNQADELLEYVKTNKIATTDYLNPNSEVYKNDRTTYESMAYSYEQMLLNLPSGISEFYIHPAKESEELKTIAPDWRVRVADYRFFASERFKEICSAKNIEVISYNDLKRIRNYE